MKKIVLAAAALLAGSVVVFGANNVPVARADASCFGMPVTIWAGAGVTNGTPGPDVIMGNNNNNIINGNGGDDRICGLGGNDNLSGGAGDDWISGGNGNDTIYGGADDDSLWGGGGNDVIYGDGGDDFISGDYLGLDSVAPVNAIAALSTNEAREAALQAFVVPSEDCGVAPASLPAGCDLPGNDKIYAGAGNDMTIGGLGSDESNGEAGNDLMIDFVGTDKIRGGPDGDTIFTVLDCGTDADGEQGEDLILSILGIGADFNALLNEQLVLKPVFLKGGYDNDVIISLVNVGDLTIYGGYGDDFVLAAVTLFGNVTVKGDAGSDLLMVGGVLGFGVWGGNASIYGGANDDVILSTVIDGNVYMAGDSGVDSCSYEDTSNGNTVQANSVSFNVTCEGQFSDNDGLP